MKRHVFLMFISEPFKGKSRFYVTETPLLVGRSAQSNIKIDNDNFCSREHALLFWENDKFMIRDLASTNGTFVNSKLIREPTILEQGDIIKVGNTEFILSAKNIK